MLARYFYFPSYIVSLHIVFLLNFIFFNWHMHCVKERNWVFGVYLKSRSGLTVPNIRRYGVEFEDFKEAPCGENGPRSKVSNHGEFAGKKRSIGKASGCKE